MVSSPGMATRACASWSAKAGHPLHRRRRAQARILASHHQRTAAPPQRSSGVQERVAIPQMGEGVHGDLDDVRVAPQRQTG